MNAEAPASEVVQVILLKPNATRLVDEAVLTDSIAARTLLDAVRVPATDTLLLAVTVPLSVEALEAVRVPCTVTFVLAVTVPDSVDALEAVSVP